MMTRQPQAPLFCFAVVTDTHLTVPPDFPEDGAEAAGRLTRLYGELVDRVNAMGPSFVVHLGDMVDPVPVSARHEASIRVFHKLSQGFSMPCHPVPGNHDIGEKLHKALPHLDDQVSITRDTIAQYEGAQGRSYYSFEQRGCLFIVLNSLLFNSGFAEEEAQWEWLSATLAENAGKRSFVFTHYPMFLTSRDEPDYYDNLEEPARTRMAELLLGHDVEGYFAGHVHGFFYDYLDGLHQTVVPSATILRSDYMEMFRARPTREMGTFDPSKLGFLWVEVYPDRHIPHFVRLGESLPYRVHSRQGRSASVTMDLRLPWCETTDVPCAWGLEIFERKEIRNDYPLAALWEMGITDFRVPISDLLEPRVAHRVKQLMALGHGFTIVSFGLPNAARREAIAESARGIRAIEIVAFPAQFRDLAPGLAELRRLGGFEVFLNAVRAEVEGWTTHHGLSTDRPEEIAQVLGCAELANAVDGFVFGLRRDRAPFDGLGEVQKCLAGTPYKPMLHVSNVAMVWSMRPDDMLDESAEMSRTAEAAMLARAHPGIAFVIDNFVELERGYSGCHGLVDRFYNPKAGSRVLTGMNALLPERITDLVCHETDAGRALVAEHAGGAVVLICGSPGDRRSDTAPRIDATRLGRRGRLIDLTTGEEESASLDEAFEKRRTARRPVPPMLLLQPRAEE